MRSVAVRSLVVTLAAQLVAGPAVPVVSAQGKKDKKDERTIERTGKTEAAKGSGDRWAVVVGVDQYESKEVEPLGGAVADAKAIRDVLIKYAEFPEQQVLLLVSDGAVKPTKLNIMEKMEQIKQAAKPADMLLFFFAGHGVQVDGQRYLLTYEARVNSSAAIKSTAMPAAALMQELEAMKVAHRVIMVDACRNDPTKPGGKPNVADEGLENAFTLQPASEGGVRATFLSSSKGQSAYEWSEKRRGFFSFFIEKGLSGEAAQYGKVTVTSLLGYLNEHVPQKVREQKNQLQIPYAKVDGTELVLVRAERLPKTVIAQDQAPPPPQTRTLYGVIKDSEGRPLIGAKVAVIMPTPRGTPPPAAERTVTIASDEDGFFKLDIPPDGIATVTVSKDNYVPKTLTSTKEESGKKMVVFLPKAEVVRVAQATPPPPPPPTPRPTATPAKQQQVASSTPKPPTPPPPTPAPAATPLPTARADELALVAYRTFLAEDFKEAENAARVALQTDPNNALANAVLGNAMAALGINTGDKQKTAAAKEYIDKALARDDKQALGHSARGLMLFADGKLPEARGQFQKAVQLDPRLGTAHSNLAYILSFENKLPEAERECREAIRLQPESAVPYNCLSDVLFKQKKYKDSVKAAREAIGRYELRDKLLGLYYVQLAVAQYSQGKQDEALEAVGRAKALGVQDHEAFSTIEKAKKKKG
jgi:Tfp pilus assembly protein PilF